MINYRRVIMTKTSYQYCFRRKNSTYRFVFDGNRQYKRYFKKSDMR